MSWLLRTYLVHSTAISKVRIMLEYIKAVVADAPS